MVIMDKQPNFKNSYGSLKVISIFLALPDIFHHYYRHEVILKHFNRQLELLIWDIALYKFCQSRTKALVDQFVVDKLG